MVDRNQILGTIFTANVEGFIGGINAMKRELRTFATMLGSVTASTDKYAKASQDLARSTGTLSASLGKVNAELKPLGKATAYVANQQKNAAHYTDRFAFSLNNVVGALRRVAMYGLAGGLFYGVIQSVRGAITTISQFDQELKNLQAVTKGTDTEIYALQQQIIATGTALNIPLKDIAQGATILGQAGFSAAETLNVIDSASKLAAGTLSDLTKTTDLLSSVLVAFNLKAFDAANVTDVMAAAVNKSKLTVEGLRVAFNYVGSMASFAGLSINETAAAMMALSNRGLRFSTIGTGMRRILAEMVSPSKQLREALEANKLTVDDINPTVVGFEQSLKALTTVLYDNEKGAISATRAFKIFEKLGGQPAAILAQAYRTREIEKMLRYTRLLGGTQEMVNKQMEGLASKATNLKNNLQALLITLGDGGIKGIFGDVLDLLNNLIKSVNSLAKSALPSLTWAFSTMKDIAVIVTGTLASLSGQVMTYIRNISALVFLIDKIKNSATAQKVSAEIGVRQSAATVSEKTGQIGALKEYKSRYAADPKSFADIATGMYQTGLFRGIPLTKENIGEQATKAMEKLYIDSLRTLGGNLKTIADKDLPDDMRREQEEMLINMLVDFAKQIGGVTPQTLGKRTKEIESAIWKLLPSNRYGATRVYQKVVGALSIPDVPIIGTAPGVDTPPPPPKGVKEPHVFDQTAFDAFLAGIRSKYAQELPQAQQYVYELAKEIASANATLDNFVKSATDAGKSKLFIDALKKETSQAVALSGAYYAAKVELDKLKAEGESTEALDSIGARLTKFIGSEEDIARRGTFGGGGISRITDMINAYKGNAARYYTDKGAGRLTPSQITAGKDALEKEVRDIEKAMDAEDVILENNVKAWKKRDDAIEVSFRQNKIKVDNYVAHLKKGLTGGVISQREYDERMLKTSEDTLEGLTAGYKEAQTASQSWAETMRDVAIDLPKTMSSGFADAFMQFIDGTKKAGAAFQDFAVGVVKELFKMIVTQQMFNLLTGAGSFFGMGLGGGTTPAANAGGSLGLSISGGAGLVAPTIPGFHSGGIVGRDLSKLKMHKGGLANNEVPAILQKGEGVFTQEQMAALGKQNLTVVNVPDQRALLSILNTPEGKNAIINIISTNKNTIQKLVLR